MKTTCRFCTCLPFLNLKQKANLSFFSTAYDPCIKFTCWSLFKVSGNKINPLIELRILDSLDYPHFLPTNLHI